MTTKRTLDKSDLQSIEMDIISIRHKGGVQAYLQSHDGDLLIYKLEKLLSELKGE